MLRAANQNLHDCRWQSYHNFLSTARRIPNNHKDTERGMRMKNVKRFLSLLTALLLCMSMRAKPVRSLPSVTFSSVSSASISCRSAASGRKATAAWVSRRPFPKPKDLFLAEKENPIKRSDSLFFVVFSAPRHSPSSNLKLRSASPECSAGIIWNCSPMETIWLIFSGRKPLSMAIQTVCQVSGSLSVR